MTKVFVLRAVATLRILHHHASIVSIRYVSGDNSSSWSLSDFSSFLTLCFCQKSDNSPSLLAQKLPRSSISLLVDVASPEITKSWIKISDVKNVLSNRLGEFMIKVSRNILKFLR